MSVIHGRRQAGSTLIEILVTLVILAIGILGVFALQTSSLKSNQNSYLRTQATILSYDIMERIRANRQGVNNGSYNNPTPGLTANCLATAGCSLNTLSSNGVISEPPPTPVRPTTTPTPKPQSGAIRSNCARLAEANAVPGGRAHSRQGRGLHQLHPACLVMPPLHNGRGGGRLSRSIAGSAAARASARRSQTAHGRHLRAGAIARRHSARSSHASRAPRRPWR